MMEATPWYVCLNVRANARPRSWIVQWTSILSVAVLGLLLTIPLQAYASHDAVYAWFKVFRGDREQSYNWITISCSETFCQPQVDASKLDTRRFERWCGGNPLIFAVATGMTETVFTCPGGGRWYIEGAVGLSLNETAIPATHENDVTIEFSVIPLGQDDNDLQRSFKSDSGFTVADTLTYDNFYDGINWFFKATANLSCSSTPGPSYTPCGDSSNNRWRRISWAWPEESCPLYPSLASTSKGYLYLQVPGSLQQKGAQIESIRNDYWYGSYRAKLKAGAHSGSTSQGSVNGFFFSNSSKQEIDVEILGNEYPDKRIHFVTHPGGYEKICLAPADPSRSFIEYGFDWYKDKVVFFVNGRECTEPQTSAVPSGRGSILLNHWTGNPAWGGTPPPSVSTMTVDYVWHTPFLLVTYPDSSGIVWRRGTSNTIKWNRYGDVSSSSVTIELWKGGTFDQTIRSGAPNTGLYRWVVPSSLPVASNYRIKVKSSLSGDYYDFSNNDFRIQ